MAVREGMCSLFQIRWKDSVSARAPSKTVSFVARSPTAVFPTQQSMGRKVTVQ